MRRLIILIICLGLLIGAGCEGRNKKPPFPADPKGGVETVKLSFEHLDVNRAPDGVAKVIERNKSSETNGLLEDGGKYWVFITRGVKPTGGFSVRVSDISMEKGEKGETRMIVRYRYSDPAPDQFVTQVLTTPKAVVLVKGLKKKPDEVEFIRQD